MTSGRIIRDDEPDSVAANRLIRGEPSTGTVTKTIDAEYALSALRSENSTLRAQVQKNAEIAEHNKATHQKDYASWRQENLRLQTELLASQDRVFELQDKLLALRQNSKD